MHSFDISDLTAEFTSIFFPGQVSVKRGVGWLHITGVMPIAERVTVDVQLTLSVNEDEKFYCLGLFVGKKTWLHVLFTFDEQPRIVIYPSELPKNGASIP